MDARDTTVETVVKTSFPGFVLDARIRAYIEALVNLMSRMVHRGCLVANWNLIDRLRKKESISALVKAMGKDSIWTQFLAKGGPD